MKDAGEKGIARETALDRDLLDGHFGGSQEGAGTLNSALTDELNRAHPQSFMKQAPEMSLADVHLTGDLLHSQVLR